MKIKGYDQWKTASPYDDDYDVLEDADKVVRAVDRAMMDWEIQPGPWKHHIDELKRVVKELCLYINEEM